MTRFEAIQTPSWNVRDKLTDRIVDLSLLSWDEEFARGIALVLAAYAERHPDREIEGWTDEDEQQSEEERMRNARHNAYTDRLIVAQRRIMATRASRSA